MRTADEVESDFVLAAVALPMWFPLVVIDGARTSTRSISDANLEEAVCRGADELWVIWTVSRQARQLTTFRATGPTVRDRADALRRFGQLFAGKLWDVYEQGVLSSSPF